MRDKRPEILVVDDDRAAAHILQLRLAKAGYTVHTAFDGAEAVRTYERVHPQWVFLDASMPELSGLEVCQHIRQDDPERRVKIVFLSGAEMPSQNFVRNCADWSGADEFIPKPYYTAQIVEMINRETGETADENGEVAHSG